jgi:hypothetical protein
VQVLRDEASRAAYDRQLQLQQLKACVAIQEEVELGEMEAERGAEGACLHACLPGMGRVMRADQARAAGLMQVCNESS